MVFGASRRRALKGALAAGTAAFIAACGGGSKNESGGSSGSSGSSGGSGTPTTGGKVVENVVAKVTPGQYEKKIAASQEELDEAKTAKRGGTLKARYLEPPHFDAALNFSCTIYDTHELSYNKAIRAKLGPKADPFKLELEPDLAEKWEQTAPDATEFVFSFRKNAKWHNREPLNGRPFTAEDAKLVFERYQSGGALKDFFSMVDKWEQPDQYTLRAKLKEPYVDFPASIATYAYITPKELWFNSDKIKTEVVGTGLSASPR